MGLKVLLLNPHFNHVYSVCYNYVGSNEIAVGSQDIWFETE